MWVSGPDSKAPPPPRTGERKEACHWRLPSYVFLEESLPFNGPPFPQLKKALGRVVGGTDSNQG